MLSLSLESKRCPLLPSKEVWEEEVGYEEEKNEEISFYIVDRGAFLAVQEVGRYHNSSFLKGTATNWIVKYHSVLLQQKDWVKHCQHYVSHCGFFCIRINACVCGVDH